MWQIALFLVCQKNRLLSGRLNYHLLLTNGLPELRLLLLVSRYCILEVFCRNVGRGQMILNSSEVPIRPF